MKFALKIGLTFLSLVYMTHLAAVELPSFADLVEEQGVKVVNISTKTQIDQPSNIPVPEDDPFYDFFRRFAPPEGGKRESRSLGSGFIFSSDGFILTNSHVVAGADDITVKLNDKREYAATVIGVDKRTDVAVIKIEASGLPFVSIGDPEKLRVGDWVLAIGSPFGFESTVTAGIVSAKGRSLPQENYVPFIQTDVAINPGNSGGPLFNLEGEVVGINAQIYSRTGGFMGLSFAIPIDVAVDVADQLRTDGRVKRGRIGVVIQEVTAELAESFGLDRARGALVSRVEKGAAASKAGIATSDIILTFDGTAVETSNDLPRIVGQTRPGEKVKVEVWRNKKSKTLNLTVGEIPPDVIANSEPKSNKTVTANVIEQLGLAVSDIDLATLKGLELESGVLIDRVAGAGEQAGLRTGDIVLALNNDDVKSVAQFKELMKGYESARSVALLIQRGGGSLYVPIRLKSK
ncbi:DegQ family serine endoprotease [Burkholderiales bacterium]|nr:DegQ family serine endoprotease [Burkholderiales bacterium]